MRHRGHAVEITEHGDDAVPVVRVDGTDLMVRREGKRYSAPMFNMFAEFDSLDELVAGIVETSPVFLAQREQRKPHEEGGGHASGA